ncbi:hypothetical protein FB45DRAFT_1069413 [Roridomyces roridus]|uniref:Uncharacterized protein n=1 Tax=Roridomyces roridus TaxID=1738132 RepID=A0AAD7AZC1_9AGAR|nr:hypothetical protein FB45DRAFT_1069413 [Roridomyces roridus]
MTIPHIPPEIVEAILDEIQETSTVSALAQSRLFHSLLFDVDCTYNTQGYRRISPWQATRLFKEASPHLALYVRRLRIAIPQPSYPFRGRPEDCSYSLLEAVLPALTRVVELSLSGALIWGTLPVFLRTALGTAIAQPSVIKLNLSISQFPASLITVTAASVRELTLPATVNYIEAASVLRVIPNGHNGPEILNLGFISPSILCLFKSGALPNVRELSIGPKNEWADICELLQLPGLVSALQRVRCDLTQTFNQQLQATPISLPRLPALRMLELSIGAEVYEVLRPCGSGDLQASVMQLEAGLPEPTILRLIADLPRKTPRIERIVVRVMLPWLQDMDIEWVPSPSELQIQPFSAPGLNLLRLEEIHWCLGTRNKVNNGETREKESRMFDGFVGFVQNLQSEMFGPQIPMTFSLDSIRPNIYD